MPRLQVILNSFSVGEVSPRLTGRSDLEQYRKACACLHNYLVLPQGGVTRRPGTRFVAEVKNSTGGCVRLLRLEPSPTAAYVIEAGDGYFRFYRNNARINYPSGAAFEVESPYAIADVFGLHTVPSIDVLYLLHPNYQTRKLERYADTCWKLRAVPFAPPPSIEIGTRPQASVQPSALTGDNITLTAFNCDAFLAGDVGREVLFTGGCNTGARVGIASVTSAKIAVVNVCVPFIVTTVTCPTLWRITGSPLTGVTPSAHIPVGKAAVTLTADVNTWRGGINGYRADGDCGKFVILNGGCFEITAVTSATVAAATIRGKATPDTAAKAESGNWTLEEALFSACNGFAETGAFHDGRLYLGAGHRFAGSKTGDFENFAIGSVDDDAVLFAIDSETLETIRWLHGRKGLLIGTASATWDAIGATDAPITPSNIQVQKATTWGASRVPPVHPDVATIYVGRGGRQLRELAFVFDADSFKAPDLLLLAEHLTRRSALTGIDPTLIDLAYQHHPESRLWAVRSDGVLLVCTYLRDQNVIAWSRVTTQGFFESVTVLPHPAGDRDQVWVAVRRVLNGVTKRFIEYLDDRVPETVHEPDGVTPGPAVPWTLEAATRLNPTFPAASVFVDDLTVYAFHVFDGAVIKPMQYDVSVDGGVTFPTQRATAFSPVGNDDVLSARTILLANNTRRFVVLLNASQAIAYSDTVITLPTASTWTQVTPPGSVGAPLGFEFNGLNGVVLLQGGSGIALAFTTDGGTTWGASSPVPTDTVTTPFGYQVLASPSAGIWCLINPSSGKIYRSTDSGASFPTTAVKSMTAGDSSLPAVAALFAVTATRMVAVYKGQVATSDDAGLTWTDGQNCTLPAFSALDVKQGGIGWIASFGESGGVPVLGGATNYATAFDSVTTRRAFWRSTDRGTTWVLVDVVGGGLVTTNPTTAITAFAARAGRGVIDIWNIGTTTRNTWNVTPSVDIVTPGAERPGVWPWQSLYTDSAVVYSGNAVGTVTGLGHLECASVQVVADGSVRPITTVIGGAITLSPCAAKVEVGLGYTSDLVTLRPEIPVGGQAMLPAKLSWVRLGIKLLETLGMQVGTASGEEIVPFRTAQDCMGFAPALFSGTKELSHLGWDEAQVIVRQLQPLPSTILAITGVLDEGGA